LYNAHKWKQKKCNNNNNNNTIQKKNIDLYKITFQP